MTNCHLVYIWHFFILPYNFFPTSPLLSCHTGLSVSFSFFLLLTARSPSCSMDFISSFFRSSHGGLIVDIQILVEMPSPQKGSLWLAQLEQQALSPFLPRTSLCYISIIALTTIRYFLSGVFVYCLLHALRCKIPRSRNHFCLVQ